jgi:hypothetical protein
MTPEEAASEFDACARELDQAISHYRSVAAHFRQREIPRACAHVCAAQGHIQAAQKRYENWLVAHSRHSEP